MSPAEKVARRVAIYTPAPEHVVVVSGAVATALRMACEIEHRTISEQAALLALAQTLERAGVQGLVEQVMSSCDELGGDW